MQFSTLFSLTMGLAASAVATTWPTPGNYSEAVKWNVTGQIQVWQTAIDTVNVFVDNIYLVKDPKEVSRLAKIAFAAAQNEGTSNTIISGEVKLDATGTAASKALPAHFDFIGPAINDTIYHPWNVQKNVDIVNQQRCAPPRGEGAISEENDVQQAAATAVGAVILPAETPLSCYFPAPY